MSERFRRQDATGVVIDNEPVGIDLIYATTTPTATASGYEVGCLWINTSGSAGTVLYVNVGSNTSATWVNIA